MTRSKALFQGARFDIAICLVFSGSCSFRFRMPSKQWYEDLSEIKRRCRGGKLFEDPEFPAIDSKVFKKRVLPGGQSFEWLRPQVSYKLLNTSLLLT